RIGCMDEQINSALDLLSDTLNAPRTESFALRFHRGTSRAYLIVPGHGMATTIRQRADHMIAGPWGQMKHFTLI
ncbi:MAG: hypothetical protein MI741_10160, partial [Rhodospirillales bacterium]|nr:hypothetical protein [Rhodospirillales bacterium]